MTWIFGSFLVTPCALTSCHVVISKQSDDSASGHSGTTGVKPEGDHVVLTTWADLDRVQRVGGRARDTQPSRGIRVSDEGLQGGASVTDSRKKIWDKKMSPL